MVFRDEKGFASLILPNDDPLARKRDTQAYDITNLLHVSSCDYIMSENNYLRGRVGTIEVPRERSVDIKDRWDFELAKLMLEARETR